jgi:predicted  nucleic acid-binding Zn-ribbon protein
MRATKELLLKLQLLDDEMDALRADEESIPLQKQDLENRLKEAEAKLQQEKNESVELAKTRKDQEIELDTNNDAMTKFQSQLYQVKSNREYEALQHEITALKEKSSQIEDKILETLERTEELGLVIGREEKALKEEAERAKSEEAKLDEKLKELLDQIAIKDDERTRLVANLDPLLLKRYERIRQSKGGLAITSVENNACGGCFRRIPPHEMQNLKKDDTIITCEGCGRIIIWRWE